MTNSLESFHRALGRVAPHIDEVVTDFAGAYELAPVQRRDDPPSVVWEVGHEKLVEFVYRTSGPSDVRVYDIGLLGQLKKALRSRRLRVEHAVADDTESGTPEPALCPRSHGATGCL